MPQLAHFRDEKALLPCFSLRSLVFRNSTVLSLQRNQVRPLSGTAIRTCNRGCYELKIFLPGCSAVPALGLGMILLHSAAARVHEAEVALSLGIFSFVSGHALVLVDGQSRVTPQLSTSKSL